MHFGQSLAALDPFHVRTPIRTQKREAPQSILPSPLSFPPSLATPVSSFPHPPSSNCIIPQPASPLSFSPTRPASSLPQPDDASRHPGSARRKRSLLIVSRSPLSGQVITDSSLRERVSSPYPGRLAAHLAASSKPASQQRQTSPRIARSWSLLPQQRTPNSTTRPLRPLRPLPNPKPQGLESLASPVLSRRCCLFLLLHPPTRHPLCGHSRSQVTPSSSSSPSSPSSSASSLHPSPPGAVCQDSSPPVSQPPGRLSARPVTSHTALTTTAAPSSPRSLSLSLSLPVDGLLALRRRLRVLPSP
jgi:hypothetical protein